MEELFELFPLILLIVVSSIVKNNKKKKKQASGKPAQEPQAAAKPAAPARPAAPKVPAPAQVSFNEALEALTEMLEDHLPDPDKPAAANPAAVKVREQTSIEIETAAKQRSKIVKARVQESLSGESKVDEHGCIGGSMPEHTAEGESLSEHAAHERMRTERLEAEAAIRAADLRKPGLTELRKAVVMAEILDKPVSMRRRRI